MKTPDPTTLVVYCPKQKCGDPVPGSDGVVRYTKRQMIYVGPDFWNNAVYQCPVCGKKRIIAENALSDGYHLV